MFVAGFIGSTPMNLIPGTMTGSGVEFDGGTFALDTMPTTGTGDVYYGIRPEYVKLDPGGPLQGTVAITENLGTEFLVTVEVGATQIRATVDEGSEPQPGDSVRIAPASRRVLLYDRESGELL
jgi:multiple sugar transport system ATP-binding protein